MTTPDVPPESPIPTQANTPMWEDKSFILVVAGLIGTISTLLFKVDLNVAQIAVALGSLASIISFVIGNKWKSGKVLVEEIRAQNALDVAAEIKTATPEQAAAMIGTLVPPQVKP